MWGCYEHGNELSGCEILGFHGGEHDDVVLGFGAVYTRR
jgi:hypothetical protein